MFASLILLIGAAIGGCASAPTTDALPTCSQRTAVVTVWRDDPTPCDVQRPQRLDVLGLTLVECDDAGGFYAPTATLCVGVDY